MKKVLRSSGACYKKTVILNFSIIRFVFTFGPGSEIDGVESVWNFIFKFLYTAPPVWQLTLHRESV